MSDLLLPGDERAGPLLSDAAVLEALVRVEEEWLRVLAGAGLAPAGAVVELSARVDEDDVPFLARAAEDGGNPVVPLLALLRRRLGGLDGLGHAAAVRWLHRGLTSQDALDTALVLCLRAVCDRVLAELGTQADALARLAREHRDDVQAGRTLTQHAVPTTFGLVAAGWLHAVLDARLLVQQARDALPVQVGGAAGTLAAPAELARLAGAADPAATARGLATALAGALGLADSAPWHTRRQPLTRTGDALVTATGAWGKVAADVLVRARPEVGEASEATGGGRGGSSTMPHKRNPVLSVLVRRAALAAPAHAAALHLAAALAVDERPDGAWHAEWPALRALGRTAVVAASQTSELLAGLAVDAARLRATAEAASEDLLAERASVRALAGADGAEGSGAEQDDGLDGYLGAAGLLVDEALARAEAVRR